MLDNYLQKSAAEDARTILLAHSPPLPDVFDKPGKDFTSVDTFYVSRPAFQLNILGKTLKVFDSNGDFDKYKFCGEDKSVLTVAPLAYPLLSKYMKFSRRTSQDVKTAIGASDINYNTKDSTYTYCTVSSNWYIGLFVRHFTFDFTPHPLDTSLNFQVVLILHNHSNYADAVYKGTRIRWNGSSPVNSLRSSNRFDMVLLNSDGLLDDIDKNGGRISKLLRINAPRFSTPLIKTLISKTKDPFAMHSHLYYNKSGTIDTTNVRKINKIQVRAIPNLGSYEDSLVIVCMSIVLRRQEKEREIRVLRKARVQTTMLPGLVNPSLAGTSVGKNLSYWSTIAYPLPVETFELHRPQF